MKTFSANPSNIENKWYLIDANGLVLGRMSTIVAKMIRGKHKPSFTPHMDCGDNIIIINADKIVLTGNKINDKKYYWHTGYPGGIKETNAKKMMIKDATRVIKKSIERMLTKCALSRAQMQRVYIYTGDNHPHSGQQPEILDIASMNKKNKK